MKRHYLVTGGAGFIGSNYVHRLVGRGERVTLFDNFSRAGAQRNLEWLHNSFGQDAFNVVVGDVRNAALITETARDADVIVHLAGQVAVTTSVVDPRIAWKFNSFGDSAMPGAAEMETVTVRDTVLFGALTVTGKTRVPTMPTGLTVNVSSPLA